VPLTGKPQGRLPTPVVHIYYSKYSCDYTDPEKELDHAFYKKRLPLTIQMLQEVGIIYAQNVQKNVKNICAR
jgi:hypothetical protein